MKIAIGAVLVIAVFILVYLLLFRKKRRYYSVTRSRSRGNYRGGRR